MHLVEFALLGPLEVSDGVRLLPLGGAKQRAVLAMLLLGANRPVPKHRLVDGAWGWWAGIPLASAWLPT
jgi:DNA-binding SARP family transcriptional activator